MSGEWNWNKQLGRLAGNWMIAFGTPLIGSVSITLDYFNSVLIAVISSSIYTMISAGVMLNEWSKRRC